MTGVNNKKRDAPEDADPPVNEQSNVKKVAVEEKQNDDNTEKQESPSPTSKTTLLEELSNRFPSLPLDEKSSIPFLGLYFAASWCPDVQAATPAVEEFGAANKDFITIVYVSSDSTEQQMKDYLPSCMMAVSFKNEDERANLKRHFGACAGKELELLGMKAEDRKFGIPTLIVLDKKTGNVVTNEGVDDIVTRNGESVIEKWKGMLK
jgi:nucleoredoxin